jgi:hypothetical protein
MLRRITVFLLFVFATGAAFSQNFLRIELAANETIPSFSPIFSEFDLDLKLSNDSATAFNGIIDFEYKINGQLYTSADSVSGLNYTSSGSVIIGAGDSLIYTITVKVNGPKFTVGPSVVVIWPVGNGVLSTDSLQFTFGVTTPTGMGNLKDDRLNVISHKGGIEISNPDALSLTHVSVFDLTGRLIYNAPYSSNEIPLSNNPVGLYIAEIACANGKRKTLRFILQ